MTTCPPRRVIAAPSWGRSSLDLGRLSPRQAALFPSFTHTGQNPFHIEVDDRAAAKTVNVVEVQWDPRFGARIQRFVARDVDPMVMLICGYRATSNSSIDLLLAFTTPIVEGFEPGDELGSKLQAALAEISGGQLECRRLTTAILKQVLVTLVRRSSKV